MEFSFNKRERDILTQALEVLISEYGSVIESLQNPVMREGFENDQREMKGVLARFNTLRHQDMDDVVAHLKAGNVINAIKVYRDVTGLPLKDCKNAVEQIGLESGTMHKVADYIGGERIVLKGRN